MTKSELYDELRLFFQEYGIDIDQYRDRLSQSYDKDEFMCVNFNLMPEFVQSTIRRVCNRPPVKYLLTDIGSGLVTIIPVPKEALN